MLNIFIPNYWLLFGGFDSVKLPSDTILLSTLRHLVMMQPWSVAGTLDIVASQDLSALVRLETGSGDDYHNSGTLQTIK